MVESVPDGAVAKPAVWVIPDDLPIGVANQFIGQAVGRQEILVTLGYALIPAILGADEEQRRMQAEQVEYVPIQATGRFTMNRGRLEELRDVLTATIANHDTIYGTAADVEDVGPAS